MTEPDLCLNTEEIINGLGEVMFKYICLLPENHDGGCMLQRFDPFVRRTERSSDD